MFKNVIIGIGTGRCGTVSLTELLNNQHDTKITHEYKTNISHALNWDYNDSEFKRACSIIGNSTANNIGDVSFSNINYIEKYIEKYNNIKIIVLKRDKEETVNSYMIKTKNRNHWFNHNGEKWNIDSFWDKKYPKYDLVDKRECVSKYWDEYYIRCGELSNKYSNIYNMNINDLNNSEKVEKLLIFLGYDIPNIYTNIIKNKN